VNARTATEADLKAERPPADLLQRARQAAQQELMDLRPQPEQQGRQTLLTGHRRFLERGL